MKKDQFAEYEAFKCRCGEGAYIGMTRFDEDTEDIEVNITSTKLMWRDRFKHAWRSLVHGESESWSVVADRTELIEALSQFAPAGRPAR
ncbi:MAG TPA: hypothetical protein VIJ15_09715 [Dermatophilaceae bacterium]